MGENELAAGTARRSILRRLDYLPAWAAIGSGVGLGAVAGVGLARGSFGGGVWMVVLFVAALAAAARLAFSGEPVGVLEAPVQAVDEVEEPEPPVPAVPQDAHRVAIPGGSFLMGSPGDEEWRYEREGPVHEVRVSSFQLMQHPVTHQQYAKVMGGVSNRQDIDRPVNDVTWWDATEYCNRLSEREGFLPCYWREGDAVEWDRSADGFRLPTEAEWEFACRAGSQTRWSFGEDEEELDRYVWFESNSENQPQPVGQKEPNPWELYDMHGNVYEWCWDWFGDYPEEPQTDPTGPDDGSFRVLRGGAYFDSLRGLRSASRVWDKPVGRSKLIGFRCARSPRRQP